MNIDHWPLYLDLPTALWIVFDAGLMLLCVVFLVRITGLRAFAKMSAFDFTVTVAVGSVIAAIVLDPDKSIIHGLLVVAVLMLAQVIISLSRLASRRVRETVDNTPLLLMDGPTILDQNLHASRVTREDLYAKLREANVTNFDDVIAVVLETTGEFSVLHGKGDQADVASLLEGVRRK